MLILVVLKIWDALLLKLETVQFFVLSLSYRSADKSLVRPGRKQADVSIRMACIPSAPCLAEKKKLDDSSRLDVVEIVRLPDMLPRSCSSWSG